MSMTALVSLAQDVRSRAPTERIAQARVEHGRLYIEPVGRYGFWIVVNESGYNVLGRIFPNMRAAATCLEETA